MNSLNNENQSNNESRIFKVIKYLRLKSAPKQNNNTVVPIEPKLEAIEMPMDKPKLEMTVNSVDLKEFDWLINEIKQSINTVVHEQMTALKNEIKDFVAIAVQQEITKNKCIETTKQKIGRASCRERV